MTNLLPITELDLSLFDIKRTSGHDLCAVAEASTIGFRGAERIYADACDIGIAVRSPKTGIVERFVFDHEDRRNGETISWRFAALNVRCPVQRIIIFND